MDKADRERLTANLVQLSAKTQWGPKLESLLLERKVFSRTLLEPILARPEAERARQLYLDVQKRGPRAYAALLGCLAESGNYEAARVLNPAIEVPQEVQLLARNK